jgi:hypothetical protein
VVPERWNHLVICQFDFLFCIYFSRDNLQKVAQLVDYTFIAQLVDYTFISVLTRECFTPLDILGGNWLGRLFFWYMNGMTVSMHANDDIHILTPAC